MARYICFLLLFFGRCDLAIMTSWMVCKLLSSSLFAKGSVPGSTTCRVGLIVTTHPLQRCDLLEIVPFLLLAYDTGIHSYPMHCRIQLNHLSVFLDAHVSSCFVIWIFDSHDHSGGGGEL
ncbi:hypothetical protein HD806DRAFT_485559 [Xylariaceae sp. AK1471]|nr:hypothetical protein HD806DRAFT_485559 [Xylariaceae sp. AK1471]